MTPADTDWARIAVLYGVLAAVRPSPVVELNRAVAVARVLGPAEGLRLVDAIAGAGQLGGYYLLPAARGDMLWRLERYEEAAEALAAAARLTTNEPERDFLFARAAMAAAGGAP
jgi:predicted RNA polymerase sigma factor